MDAAADARRDGFTLAEVIVSLGLFALIAVGGLGALGPIRSGGALGATPAAVGAVRLSKDHTAAGVYLQGVLEYLAGLTGIPLVPGSYAAPFPAEWTGMPVVPSGPEQVGGARLVVAVERWHWDDTAGRYCVVGSPGCAAVAAGEYLTRASATLTWEFRGVVRSMTLVRCVP